MAETIDDPAPIWGHDKTPRDRRNEKRLLWATLFWALCFTVASQGIKRGFLPEGPVAWLVALLPTVAGILVVFVYSKFLRETDELQRLIQFQALAVGFGGTLFAVSGYKVLQRAGAPAAELGDVTLVMMVFYALGTFIGWRRYC